MSGDVYDAGCFLYVRDELSQALALLFLLLVLALSTLVGSANAVCLLTLNTPGMM